MLSKLCASCLLVSSHEMCLTSTSKTLMFRWLVANTRNVPTLDVGDQEGWNDKACGTTRGFLCQFNCLTPTAFPTESATSGPSGQDDGDVSTSGTSNTGSLLPVFLLAVIGLLIGIALAIRILFHEQNAAKEATKKLALIRQSNSFAEVFG